MNEILNDIETLTIVRNAVSTGVEKEKTKFYSWGLKANNTRKIFRNVTWEFQTWKIFFN